jgi:hypothetical protein
MSENRDQYSVGHTSEGAQDGCVRADSKDVYRQDSKILAAQSS